MATGGTTQATIGWRQTLDLSAQTRAAMKGEATLRVFNPNGDKIFDDFNTGAWTEGERPVKAGQVRPLGIPTIPTELFFNQVPINLGCHVHTTLEYDTLVTRTNEFNQEVREAQTRLLGRACLVGEGNLNSLQFAFVGAEGNVELHLLGDMPADHNKCRPLLGRLHRNGECSLDPNFVVYTLNAANEAPQIPAPEEPQTKAAPATPEPRVEAASDAAPAPQLPNAGYPPEKLLKLEQVTNSWLRNPQWTDGEKNQLAFFEALGQVASFDRDGLNHVDNQSIKSETLPREVLLEWAIRHPDTRPPLRKVETQEPFWFQSRECRLLTSIRDQRTREDLKKMNTPERTKVTHTITITNENGTFPFGAAAVVHMVATNGTFQLSEDRLSVKRGFGSKLSAFLPDGENGLGLTVQVRPIRDSSLTPCRVLVSVANPNSAPSQMGLAFSQDPDMFSCEPRLRFDNGQFKMNAESGKVSIGKLVMQESSAESPHKGLDFMPGVALSAIPTRSFGPGQEVLNQEPTQTEEAQPAETSESATTQGTADDEYVDIGSEGEAQPETPEPAITQDTTDEYLEIAPEGEAHPGAVADEESVA